MADYYLNLGFNWNSTTIGSLWSVESTDYRFLQYALADADGNPAWFQFRVDDTLYVQLWDLSTQVPPLSASGLDMSLSALDAGTPGTYDPATLMDLQGNATAQTKTVGDRSNAYLQFPGGSWSYDGATPYGSPWGPCRGKATLLGPVRFTCAASFKLSFYLTGTIVIDGERTSHVFVSDPEVIVGSTGSSN